MLLTLFQINLVAPAVVGPAFDNTAFQYGAFQENAAAGPAFDSTAFQYGAFQENAPQTTRVAGGGSGSRRRNWYIVEHKDETPAKPAKPERKPVRVKARPDLTYTLPEWAPRPLSGEVLLPGTLERINVEAEAQALAELSRIVAHRRLLDEAAHAKRQQDEEEEFLRMVLEVL